MERRNTKWKEATEWRYGMDFKEIRDKWNADPWRRAMYQIYKNFKKLKKCHS